MPFSRRIGLRMSAWSTSSIVTALAGGGDAAGEAAADRDAHALLDLLLDALGGARAEHLAARLEQQDRGGVDVQDRGDAVEQLDQQLVRRQVGERGVRDALK